MSKMFYNYDNDVDLELINQESSLPIQPIQSAPNMSVLYNIKGEMYGIEVKHNMPFTLYFHLEELHGWNLNDFVGNSLVNFKILTQNHKTVLEKTFNGNEVFTPTGDLVIHICHPDVEVLKQESYRMELTLQPGIGIYQLFSERDGLLVVR